MRTTPSRILRSLRALLLVALATIAPVGAGAAAPGFDDFGGSVAAPAR